MLTELLSGIWISDIKGSYDETFYKDNLIDIVINCTVDQAFLDLPKIYIINLKLINCFCSSLSVMKQGLK